jgi:hypothetical protein
LLGGFLHRLAEVGVGVVHKAIDQGNVFMRVAIRDEHFCKGGSQDAAVTVIASSV